MITAVPDASDSDELRKDAPAWQDALPREITHRPTFGRDRILVARDGFFLAFDK
jgi:hypothetical protein